VASLYIHAMMEFVKYFLGALKDSTTYRAFLWSEIFHDGGVNSLSHFFLKIVAVEQPLIFLIRNVGHFYQYGGDIRGF